MIKEGKNKMRIFKKKTQSKRREGKGKHKRQRNINK